MARVRRMSDETLRQVFRQLQRVGLLEPLIAHLEDMGDTLHERIQVQLSGLLITDAEKLAALQALQGALGNCRDLAAIYRELGRAETLGAQGSARSRARAAASARSRVSS